METFYCNYCFHPLNLFHSKNDKDNSVSSTSISRIKAYLTNCQHLFCQACKDKSKVKCCICGRTPCKFVEINSLMPFNYRLLFEPISKLYDHLQISMKFSGQQNLFCMKKFKQTENLYMKTYNEEKKISAKDLQVYRDKVGLYKNIQRIIYFLKQRFVFYTFCLDLLIYLCN